ncbi:hypothetical protein R1flu_009188 [Riccia fluitans]|uniref:Uncharacterized protein n=1 Tax=Riccia fluitans TaxID=41844 RepID=A0ABD1Z1D5_9MARC
MTKTGTKLAKVETRRFQATCKRFTSSALFVSRRQVLGGVESLQRAGVLKPLPLFNDRKTEGRKFLPVLNYCYIDLKKYSTWSPKSFTRSWRSP